MDAHHTVTVEEWGSLPPKTASTYLRSVDATVMIDCLTFYQGVRMNKTVPR
jgi:hypothetical protein